MSPRCTKISSTAVAFGIALLLASCSVAGSSDAPSTAATNDPVDEDAPAIQTQDTVDWSSLPGCPVTETTPWMLVADYPSDAIDAAGLVPECGDIWQMGPEETFASIALDSVTTEGIEHLGTELESRGFVLLVDDFTPESPSDKGYYGARDYYLDGNTSSGHTRVAFEIYPSSSAPSSWSLYLDYVSASTRALAE